MVKKLKVTVKSSEANFKAYQEKVRAYVLEVNRNFNKRYLMSIEPANEQGHINGMAIPELIMLVNLNNGTGEDTLLEVNGKTLHVVAKKKLPCIPLGLL